MKSLLRYFWGFPSGALLFVLLISATNVMSEDEKPTLLRWGDSTVSALAGKEWIVSLLSESPLAESFLAVRLVSGPRVLAQKIIREEKNMKARLAIPDLKPGMIIEATLTVIKLNEGDTPVIERKVWLYANRWADSYIPLFDPKKTFLISRDRENPFVNEIDRLDLPFKALDKIDDFSEGRLLVIDEEIVVIPKSRGSILMVDSVRDERLRVDHRIDSLYMSRSTPESIGKTQLPRCEEWEPETGYLLTTGQQGVSTIFRSKTGYKWVEISSKESVVRLVSCNAGVYEPRRLHWMISVLLVSMNQQEGNVK